MTTGWDEARAGCEYLNRIRVLERSEHPISRKQMSAAALKVLYRLRSKKYMAFLVGGALRDLFRGKNPRDFDVVTNAGIAEIRKLFRNSRTVGKRFTIVHTFFGPEVVEVSTFKIENQGSKHEMVLADALQRDFTVNAVYYDIDTFKVIDPLGGLSHLDQGLAVVVGDPLARFSEDPVRMLRALKLLVKHGLRLDPPLERAMREYAPLLAEMGDGRKYEELTRILLDDQVGAFVEQCLAFGFMDYLWPGGRMLVERLKPSGFEKLRQSVPIQYARASYAKPSHTHLWMKLFLKSGAFEPSPHAEEVKAQFEHFIKPLGMPFRGPIVDTLCLIGQLSCARKPHWPEGKTSQEVLKLLKAYLEDRPKLRARILPALEQKWEEKKEKAGAKGGRRRRRRRYRRRGKRGRGVS